MRKKTIILIPVIFLIPSLLFAGESNFFFDSTIGNVNSEYELEIQKPSSKKSNSINTSQEQRIEGRRILENKTFISLSEKEYTLFLDIRNLISEYNSHIKELLAHSVENTLTRQQINNIEITLMGLKGKISQKEWDYENTKKLRKKMVIAHLDRVIGAVPQEGKELRQEFRNTLIDSIMSEGLDNARINGSTTN